MLTFNNVPLQFMFLLTHSGSLRLTLIQSGSLWLFLWLSQALIGLQRPCSAHHVVTAWPQFILLWLSNSIQAQSIYADAVAFLQQIRTHQAGTTAMIAAG